MRFAIVDNERIEAKFGLQVICSVCQEKLFAKCGKIRVHHWSHRTEKKCDDRWENQTQWHRDWKNNYPINWQEKHHIDEETEEAHTADVLTEHNLVIEFQHSHIESTERESRENFYTNMVWVVNGLRLKNTYCRFKNSLKYNFLRKEPNVYHAVNVEECLPLQWTACKVPVIFDFQCGDLFDKSSDNIQYLYCLLPVHIGHCRVVIKIKKSAFIKSTSNGEWQKRVILYLNKIREEEDEWNSLKNNYKGLF